MKKGILHITSLARLNAYHLFFTVMVLLVFGQAPARSNTTDELTTTNVITLNTNNDNANPSPDFDGDGIVGIPDFLLFVEQFGLSRGDEGYDAKFDLDGSHTIGIGDFLIFVDAFGKEIPSSTVAIPDANLRAAIEIALGKASGTPITVAEMETLTRFEAHDAGIGDLEGLQFATNLTWLNIGRVSGAYWPSEREKYNSNTISDFSPLAGLSNLASLYLDYCAFSNDDLSLLSGLTKLEKLSLRVNYITDVSPLENLTTLKELNLMGNGISDITPLGSLSDLVLLSVGKNAVTDLSPLSGLTNLQVLSINDNPMSDITPLAGMTNLRKLYIGGSLGSGKLSDISALAGLINLEELVAIGHTEVTDITPLAGMTKLRRLSLADMDILDITPLAGMTDMRDLFLPDMGVSDITPLTGMTKMWNLEIMRNNIADVSPVAGMTNLEWLVTYDNEITDVSPLASLTNLRGVYLDANNISDLAPLVANTGLGSGDVVEVRRNPLNGRSISTHIPSLQARGVEVAFSEIAIQAGAPPQIYNDNLFILPVAENLATDELPLQDYTARFYEYFDDEFDFLFLVSNLPFGADEHGYWGSNLGVRNDVQGIGLPAFSDDSWGSGEKLQSVIHLTFDFAFSNGPSLHELMHRWANFIIPAYIPHWGFTSANGNLGGFDIANLVDHGEGRYTAGDFTFAGYAGPAEPFSPIELYLAGFISPEEVPDLWVVEDGEEVRNEGGGIVKADNGYPMFRASRVRTYTIEDIIAEHGPRVPDHSQAQRHFRAAAILLVNENDPVYSNVLADISVEGVSWFSHAGGDEYDQSYNFYEATGGRATITMDGLSQFQRRASVNKPAASSFGTPPPPIVDSWE